MLSLPCAVAGVIIDDATDAGSRVAAQHGAR
jgi:hypothetical protein